MSAQRSRYAVSVRGRLLTTAREPLSVRAVRLTVRVLVGIGLLVVLVLMVGGVWVIWAMGGVE